LALFASWYQQARNKVLRVPSFEFLVMVRGGAGFFPICAER
jgi:hypothetical protein